MPVRPYDLLADSPNHNMVSGKTAWSVIPACNHVPICNEWPGHDGRPYCSIPQIGADERIPGLGAIPSSVAECLQLGPYQSLTPCQAKNNILRKRHLPLQPVSQHIRDSFDGLIAQRRQEDSVLEDDAPTPYGTYEWYQQQNVQRSFLMAPYGADKHVNDRECAFTENAGSASSEPPYGLIPSHASSSMSRSFIKLTTPVTPSAQSSSSDYAGRTPWTKSMSSSTSSESEPAANSWVDRPSAAVTRATWLPQALIDHMATLNSPNSESDFSLVDHATSPSSTPAPARAPASTPLNNPLDIFSNFDSSWHLPPLSVGRTTPQSPRTEYDFTLVKHPSSAAPTSTSTPTPISARLSTRSIQLSDLEDVDWPSTSSSVVSVEFHRDVGPDTFAYKPESKDGDRWEVLEDGEEEHLFRWGEPALLTSS